MGWSAPATASCIVAIASLQPESPTSYETTGTRLPSISKPRPVQTGRGPPSESDGQGNGARLTGASAPGLEQPGVGAQVVERAHDALLDCQLRDPAQAPHARAVQEDEGAVADPAALAAPVGEPRRDAEGPGDPADGVVDCAVLVGAEVEDRGLGLRALDGHDDRVDAVVHVEVRLALLAVAENVQDLRIGAQPLVEVENVPVRVALAENGDEAEDPTRE